MSVAADTARTRTSRRQSLRLMMGAAMLPAMGMGFPLRAVAKGERFVPPAGPMRMSRTLLRDLSDGAEIVVRREWEVRFGRALDGYTVTGDQLSVEVQAPPTLQFLARIEKDREEAGLFPLSVTLNGMIADSSEPSEQPSFDLAIERTVERINKSDLSADKVRMSRQALSELQKTAAEFTTRVPRDLFRPQQLHWREDRKVNLPRGQTGPISVVFDARRNAATELMERTERQVISPLAGSSRTSSEIWELHWG